MISFKSQLVSVIFNTPADLADQRRKVKDSVCISYCFIYSFFKYRLPDSKTTNKIEKKREMKIEKKERKEADLSKEKRKESILFNIILLPSDQKDSLRSIAL